MDMCHDMHVDVGNFRTADMEFAQAHPNTTKYTCKIINSHRLHSAHDLPVKSTLPTLREKVTKEEGRGDMTT